MYDKETASFPEVAPRWAGLVIMSIGARQLLETVARGRCGEEWDHSYYGGTAPQFELAAGAEHTSTKQ